MMEVSGTLPKWRELYPGDYFEVACLINAARAAGQPMERVRRAIAAIRATTSDAEMNQLVAEAQDRAAKWLTLYDAGLLKVDRDEFYEVAGIELPPLRIGRTSRIHHNKPKE
jgi:hypothetical protein